MISFIENAEGIEAEIEALPDALASGDAGEIERVKAAKARYDRLTDVERRLVSKAALDKLNTLIEQVEAIENAKPPQTGDRANIALWTALLILSGVAAGAAIRWRKRSCRRYATAASHGSDLPWDAAALFTDMRGNERGRQSTTSPRILRF